jgi:hypothetical protein
VVPCESVQLRGNYYYLWPTPQIELYSNDPLRWPCALRGFVSWCRAEGWQDAILSRVLGTGSPIGCHPKLILGAS